MSKLKQYQTTNLNARNDALQTMDRANNNFAQHGLNQNGEPLRQIQNELNEASRVVEVVDESPAKPKIGHNFAMNMAMKGWDEAGHLTRWFHEPDTVPVAPSYLESSAPSPLQEYQQELHTPQMEQQQEMER